MIARHLLLSGQPQTPVTMISEIEKLVQCMHDKVIDWSTNAAILDGLNFGPWTCFEFVTRKTGAHGPTKEECLSYYDCGWCRWFVNIFAITKSSSSTLTLRDGRKF